jgi:hypothetical protein
MYGKKTAVLVNLARHKLKEILFFVFRLQFPKRNLYSPGLPLFALLLGKLAKHFQIIYAPYQSPPGLITGLDGLEFGHGLFGALPVIPEITFAGSGLQGGYFLTKLSVLKDAPRFRRFLP